MWQKTEYLESVEVDILGFRKFCQSDNLSINLENNQQIDQ